MNLPRSLGLCVLSSALVLQLCSVFAANAADSELVVTVDANATGSFAIGAGIYDQCTIHFSARLVYLPDPVTGRYETPSQEQYTLSGEGAGAVLQVESWTYSGRQPGPGMVNCYLYPGDGKATVGWKYLDSYVASTPEGTERYGRAACKLAEDDFELQPESGVVHFPTNATQFTATGQGKGHYADALMQGDFTAYYTVKLGGDQWEAVILPDPAPQSTLPKYADWIPMGSAREDLPGSTFTAKVILRRKGSTSLVADRTAKARFHFHLNDTSRQPGVCMNFPPQTAAQDTPDLSFPQVSSLRVSDEGQTAETVDADLSETLVTVQCHDFGAFGRLTVDAEVAGQGSVQGFVVDHPDQRSLAIPKDDNTNHIADAWEDSKPDLPSADAKWEEAAVPEGQREDGDGISLYEKYRGFWFSGHHERLEPNKKYVFVYDGDYLITTSCLVDPAIATFPEASGCTLRFVDENTWTGSGTYAAKRRIVNFNHGFAHVADQHALEVRYIKEPTVNFPEDYQAAYFAKHGKYPRDSVGPNDQGRAYPDFTSPRIRKSPGGVLALEVYAANVDKRVRDVVRYNTRAAVPQESGESDGQWQARVNVGADNFISSHPADYSAAIHLNTVRATIHEMGHGIGVKDLIGYKPGPKTCFMRYIDELDYARDAEDRFQLLRRLWPRVYCHDPTGTEEGIGCWEQICISDNERK